MSIGNTNLGFLGGPYQFKLIYNLIWFPKFSKRILPYLSSTHFENHNYKQLFILLKNYYEKYSAVPDKIKVEQLIELHVESEIDKDMLIEVLSRLVRYSKALFAGEAENDSQHVQDEAENFVLQQKLQHVSTFLQSSINTGDLQKAKIVQEMLRDAYRVQDKKEASLRMGEFDDDITTPQYLDAIPTGITQVDDITGGLPRGKIGLFVAGQGVGKSSLLALLANNAYLAGKKVLHLVFDENDPKEMRRLHTARWCGIKTKHFPKFREYVARKYKEIHATYKTGELIIEQMSSETATVADIKSLILNKQQELGFEFDLIVIDYVDEINPQRSYKSVHEGEVEVMKSLKSMTVDLNVALWTATQGTKAVNDEMWVLFKDIGGSVAKIKKAQLVLSGGVSLSQRKTSEVNMTLLKCNYAPSGHQWEKCYFKRSVLDLQFSEVTQYVDEDTLRQGYDESEEDELMRLLTPEERGRIPAIEAELERNLEDLAPTFVPPVTKKMVGVVREHQWTPPPPSADSLKVDALKNLISDMSFDDM